MSNYTKNANVRADRLASLIVGLCAAALATAIYMGFSSCCAPGDPECSDWAKADVAGDEAIALLEAASVTWAHDPNVVSDLQRVKAAVMLVDEAIDVVIAGGSEGNLDMYLFAAIALVDELAAQAEDDDLRSALTSVRLALTMVRVLSA